MSKTETKKARIKRVKNLALRLMDEHGLIDLNWEFQWSNARSQLGNCSWKHEGMGFDGRPLFTKQIIRISKPYVVMGLPDHLIRDTILHEIAHALDVEERGTSDHGFRWKRMASLVGADPTRTCAVPPAIHKQLRSTAKWIRYCPNPECDNKKMYFTKPGHAYVRACGDCCRKHNNGQYTERFKLQWKINENRDLSAIKA